MNETASRMRNPFELRGLPASGEWLVGRDAIIQTLVSALCRHGAHQSIVGLRRIGKTSVARECSRRIRASTTKHNVVFISLNTIADVRHAWLAMLEGIAPAKKRINVSPSNETHEGAYLALLDALRKRRKKETTNIIYFLDELDSIHGGHFGDEQLFMSRLREIAGETERYGVTFVFISWRPLDWLHKVHGEGSTLGGISNPHYLKPLEKPSLATLAHRSPIPVTEDGIDALWDYTGGQPFLAEVLLCEAVEQGRPVLDKAAFDAAYDEQEVEFVNHYKHIETIFAHQNVFTHMREWLAGNPKREPPPHVPPVLRSYGLVKRSPDRSSVECISGDFQRYLEKLQRYHEANPTVKVEQPTGFAPVPHPSWAAFRDHPWTLATWPGLSLPIDALRVLIGEPKGPGPDQHPSIFLSDRMTHGAWANRNDKRIWLRHACEIPGYLIALPISMLLEDEGYSTRVDEALWDIDHADECTAGRLALNVLFLRCAAVEKNLVDISGGMIDLRQVLPERFERLLQKLQESPRPDTLAEHEPALLRVCQSVVQRWTYTEPVSLLERLWLTWRLYQTMVQHLESFDPDKRRSSIERLAKRDGGDMGEPEDRLDPVGFGREKFDHRLAAVVHALTMNLPEGSLQARRVSSRALEEVLRELANQLPRGVSVGSVLEWNAAPNIPDLAFTGLLRFNASSLGELHPETRKRHFRTLPLNNESLPPYELEAWDRLVQAASMPAAKIRRDELVLLAERLQQASDSPTTRRWRWMITTALFAAGESHLEAEVRQLLVVHSRDPRAAHYAGMVLLRLATSGDASWTKNVDELAQACVDSKGDAFVVAAALGHVIIHGPPSAKEEARKKLAEFDTTSEDSRLVELKGILGVLHDRR